MDIERLLIILLLVLLITIVWTILFDMLLRNYFNNGKEKKIKYTKESKIDEDNLIVTKRRTTS